MNTDAGILDLVRRLSDDSKRLVRGEVRLAKLETGESLRDGIHGAVWLGLAFGAAVVALVALTILLATLLGAWIGHMWAGTLIVAAVELLLAAGLVKRGLGAMRAPSYTFAESREELRETVSWARSNGH